MAETVEFDDRAFQAAYTSTVQGFRASCRAAILDYGNAAAAAMIRHINITDSESGIASTVAVENHLEEDKPFIYVGAMESGKGVSRAFRALSRSRQKAGHRGIAVEGAYHFHGLFLEFGTKYMSPRPFGRPGFLEAESAYVVKA